MISVGSSAGQHPASVSHLGQMRASLINNPMRKLRVYSLLVLVTTLATSAFPGIRPSFSLDYSSWHATHVVLVVTTGTDGAFNVIESWKGDLKIGEQVVVPELRPPPDGLPISRYPTSWVEAFHGGLSERVPRQAVGSRMILFLKSGAAASVAADGTERTEGNEWQSAALFGEMKVSALWIDGDQLYCFAQLMNPGPTVLFAFEDSQDKVRRRVAEIIRVQSEVAAALAENDGARRAACLRRFHRRIPLGNVHSDILPARLLAPEELGKSGPAALPTIRGMLDDPAFADSAEALVKALLAAGGEAVGEELNNRLRQDLAFWRSTGPTLPQNWWNQDPSPHAPLRDRYSQTYQLIVALEQTNYPAARATAVELRDFWRSVPQLDDPSGLSQIAEECDKLIEKIVSSE